MNLIYEKVHDGWIVKRIGYEYSYHAHIKNKKSCVLLIDLIHKNRMPKSTWLKGSVKRLLTEPEYKEFTRVCDRKQKYHNVQRGVRI
ncbi:hypothetical protein N9924_00975 [bacterium]|nr:hypothetical protein [bacterium]